MNEIITRIVREGDRLVVEIPEEFGAADAKVSIRKDGDALIIEPMSNDKPKFAEMLRAMEPLSKEDWPDITDSDLGPLRDVKL